MSSPDTEISRQSYDIIQKYANALFRDATLDYYGIKAARIKELISIELPVIEVRKKSTDIVFLLEDGRYLHLEFQSTYSIDDLLRFVVYDTLLYKRDGRQIDTVVVYSSDVENADVSLDIGAVKFSPQVVMFADYDGSAIITELEDKLASGQELTDHDMLNLVFLPLMKTDVPKEELAGKSVAIAQSIPDKEKRNICIASIFAFASKYLEDEMLIKLKEVIKMSDLATMLITDTITETEVKIAKRALKKGLSIEDIADLTGLDADMIQNLKDEPE